MAEAYCGPSNAVQDFKRHTQVDRSLHQDRLAGPHIPRQAFRTRDPRASTLDAEFHAFENASAIPFQEQLFGSNISTQAQLQKATPSGWATDFQQLKISDQALPVQQFRNHAPLVRSTIGGWQNEFMKQHTNDISSVAQGKQAVQSYIPQMHYQSSFNPMSMYGAMETQETPDVAQAQTIDQFSSADWSQAFEEAFQDAFKDDEQVQQAQQAQADTVLHPREEQKVEQASEMIDSRQIRIGSDAIDYTEMKDRTGDQEQQDANSLARVAGELLHNVQHDSSEKFQNSQFLDLMRKIRDRQVEVRNNDFETTAVGIDGNRVVQLGQDSLLLSDEAIRYTADPAQNQDTFAFPNMNTVYAPRENDFVDYTFDSDQFPGQSKIQTSDLHPGGKYYPEQKPTGPTIQMSGAVLENASGSGPNSDSGMPAQKPAA